MVITLKAARINAGKTQEEAATHVSKTKQTIANYENYISSPDAETAKKLADFYGVSMDNIAWSK
jgi:DNA-binding XRE family transcriptional regulator